MFARVLEEQAADVNAAEAAAAVLADAAVFAATAATRSSSATLESATAVVGSQLLHKAPPPSPLVSAPCPVALSRAMFRSCVLPSALADEEDATEAEAP